MTLLLRNFRTTFFPKLDIPNVSSSEHLPALDGLRGLAILLVILFHTFHFMPGWCGVDLFFVLSGFLITGQLIESKHHINYFKSFWIKRFLRIFPLYYLVLAIILIPKNFFNIHTVSFSSWSYWFYLQNWEYVYMSAFPDGKDTLNHFWSLAIEEQFYFVFPILIKYIPNKNLPWILISLIISAICFRYYYFNNENIGYYVATISRMDALSIGALIAIIIRENKSLLAKWTHYFFYHSLIYIVLAITINADVHFTNPLIAKFGLTAYALLFGCLLIYSLCPSPKSYFKKFLLNDILRYIGKISYGLYVFHWILYVFIKAPLEESIYNILHLSILSKIIVSLLVLLLSIILSHLSYHYFEKKIMNLKPFFLKV